MLLFLPFPIGSNKTKFIKFKRKISLSTLDLKSMRNYFLFQSKMQTFTCTTETRWFLCGGKMLKNIFPQHFVEKICLAMSVLSWEFMLFFKTGDLLTFLQRSTIKELLCQNPKLLFVMFVKVLILKTILLLKFKMFFFKYVLIVLRMIFIPNQLKKQSSERSCMKIIMLHKKIWIEIK